MKVIDFEKACELTGKDANQLPDTTCMTEIRAKRVLADHKLDVLYQASCEGKVIDLSDRNKWKYTPWLEWVPSLSAFVDSGSDYTFTNTCLGARFWFETETDSDYFGKQHIELINDLMRPGY